MSHFNLSFMTTKCENKSVMCTFMQTSVSAFSFRFTYVRDMSRFLNKMHELTQSDSTSCPVKIIIHQRGNKTLIILVSDVSNRVFTCWHVYHHALVESYYMRNSGRVLCGVAQCDEGVEVGVSVLRRHITDCSATESTNHYKKIQEVSISSHLSLPFSATELCRWVKTRFSPCSFWQASSQSGE